jgi:hypothetical protein
LRIPPGYSAQFFELNKAVRITHVGYNSVFGRAFRPLERIIEPVLRSKGWLLIQSKMMPIRVQHEDQGNLEEPEAIRRQTRRQIYDHLSNTWHLPELNSRGVNRRWLVGVYVGEFFRVESMVIKRFRVELNTLMFKKAPIVNNPETYSKISVVLEESGQRPLGFANGMIPEDSWLTDIARYVDRNNISGVFLQAIPGSPRLNILSSRMLEAKRQAETYLMGNDHLLQNKKIYTEVRYVWDSHKRLVSRTRELEEARVLVQGLEAKVRDEETHLVSSLLHAATSVYTMGNADNNPEMLFSEQHAASRLQVAEIMRL